MIKKNKLHLNVFKKSFVEDLKFINKIFSSLSVPTRMNEGNDDEDDYVYMDSKKTDDADDKSIKRAKNMEELKERLDKLKSEKNLSIKKKLMKKSLNSKSKKLARKAERKMKNKMSKVDNIVKETKIKIKKEKVDEVEKKNVQQAKPVFNSDGKLVFSKFDFTGVGKTAKKSKAEKDPQKLLDNLKQQEATVKQLVESGDIEKAAEVKQKIAWKNALAKAEGQKVKDDPILLKKTAKKMEQKKQQSKKKWDQRNEKVESGKMERQKKRQENIDKKKKERKSAKVKKSIKKGRVVI